MIKNVFNWSIGSFFRTIGRIIAYIVVGSLIGLILSNNDISISNLFLPNLSAATLTSYDTYQLYWNGQTGCGSSNKYSFTTYANSDPAGDLWQQGTLGTRVYDKGAEISFNFQYNLTANKYYDIEINFMSSDLSNSLNTTNVYVDSGTSCQDFSGSRVALIGFTLNNSGTNYSNKATIRIMANSATTYWGIRLYKGSGEFIAGPNNFGISSITIEEVDPSNTNVIIDNATNNTTNIINNNNDNTQQIIDSQNELLGHKCENLLNKNNYIIDNNGYLGFRLSNLQVGKTYTLSSNQSFDYYKFSSSLFGSPEVSGPEGSVYSTYTTFTITDNSRYLFFEPVFDSWITNISQLSNYDLMLIEGSSFKPYCEFGSYSSKLDETNNAINSQTNTIINNQNQNTQQQIESQKVCKLYDKSSIKTDNSYLSSTGSIVSNDYTTVYGITDYISISQSELLITEVSNISSVYSCFYNDTKELISCNNFTTTNITIPSGAFYLRSTIRKNTNKPQFKICTNGNQAISNSINDSDVSGATNEASSFFSNFSTDTHGLTSIITAPLSAIQSLTSATCSPLVLPLPFVNSNLTLPCMRQIYVDNFGGFITLYDTITFGIIAYWVLVRIFALVKDFKNPEHDEIEVMDL